MNHALLHAPLTPNAISAHLVQGANVQNIITDAKAITRARRGEVTGADNGFTLIELLVVVAVIGILAGIVVFGVANFRDDATTAACTAAKTTVTTAAEAYWAKNGGTTVTLVTLQGNPNAAGVATTPTYLKPGYAYPAAPCALPA